MLEIIKCLHTYTKKKANNCEINTRSSGGPRRIKKTNIGYNQFDSVRPPLPISKTKNWKRPGFCFDPRRYVKHGNRGNVAPINKR